MEIGLYEFLLILAAMVIVGIWVFMVICGKFGLLDDKEELLKNTEKEVKKQPKKVSTKTEDKPEVKETKKQPKKPTNTKPKKSPAKKEK